MVHLCSVSACLAVMVGKWHAEWMRTKHYRVTLTPTERDELRHLISTGKAAARILAHARILLKADSPPEQSGPYDADIAAAVEVSVNTVERVRQRFVEEGLQAALVPRVPTAPRPTLLDGRGEARLLAEVCSPPPGDRPRWTLQLLADRMVALQVVESISYETVRQALKKRHQTVADTALVPASTGERHLYLSDGGCAGCLPAALRSPLSPGLPR